MADRAAQMWLYFNPRSREGSDEKPFIIAVIRVISIHAPVKGATWRHRVLQIILTISIHAPVKGATPVGYLYHHDRQISIHAPVKGATLEKSGLATVTSISIHAPVKGATHFLCSL